GRGSKGGSGRSERRRRRQEDSGICSEGRGSEHRRGEEESEGEAAGVYGAELLGRAWRDTVDGEWEGGQEETGRGAVEAGERGQSRGKDRDRGDDSGDMGGSAEGGEGRSRRELLRAGRTFAARDSGGFEN